MVADAEARELALPQLGLFSRAVHLVDPEFVKGPRRSHALALYGVPALNTAAHHF